MLRLEKQALAELLWNAVRKAFPDTHEVVVPSRPTDDLWQIGFTHEAEGSENVRVLAGTIPSITEQEKKRVVRFLKGTAHGMEVALAEFKLDHPTHYVAAQIAKHLVFKDGLWRQPNASGQPRPSKT